LILDIEKQAIVDDVRLLPVGRVSRGTNKKFCPLIISERFPAQRYHQRSAAGIGTPANSASLMPSSSGRIGPCQ
jgi:hypothetical protein